MQFSHLLAADNTETIPNVDGDTELSTYGIVSLFSVPSRCGNRCNNFGSYGNAEIRVEILQKDSLRNRFYLVTRCDRILTVGSY